MDTTKMKPYDTVDTIIITNSGRTESIRLSHTMSEAGKAAIVWNFGNSRFVAFAADADRCCRINEFVSSLMDDSNMTEEMNLFTDKYTQTHA